MSSREWAVILGPLTSEVYRLDIWRITLFVLCAIGAISFAWQFRNKIGNVAFFLWSYVLIYALSIFEFPYSQYGIMNRAFESSSAQTFVEALLIPYIAIQHGHKIYRVIPFVALFEIISVWAHFPGLFKAPSFSSAFIALCVPFLPWWLQAIAVITSLTHHGSTALLVLLFEFLALILFYQRKLFFPALLGVSAFFIGACRFFGSTLMQGAHSRIVVWERFMCAWGGQWRYVLQDPFSINWKNLFIGTGPGSFMWISAILDKFQTPLFVQMHSDILQIIFEIGLVGFYLVFLVFVKAINNTKKASVFTSLWGTLAFCLTYHPLRYGASMVLISFIFYRALIIDRVDLDLADASRGVDRL